MHLELQSIDITKENYRYKTICVAQQNIIGMHKKINTSNSFHLARKQQSLPKKTLRKSRKSLPSALCVGRGGAERRARGGGASSRASRSRGAAQPTRDMRALQRIMFLPDLPRACMVDDVATYLQAPSSGQVATIINNKPICN